MSDAILEKGPNHYYYIGRDRFEFAGELIGGPLEDDLPYLAESTSESGKALIGIVDHFGISWAERVAGTISHSSSMNRFCRILLRSLEGRDAILSHVDQHASHPAVRTSKSKPETRQAFAFPNGGKVPHETWLKLAGLAGRRLARYGCIITQRDKKQISVGSGIDITPYIWSTLVCRMGLRRVNSPRAASRMDIYVPRFDPSGL